MEGGAFLYMDVTEMKHCIAGFFWVILLAGCGGDPAVTTEEEASRWVVRGTVLGTSATPYTITLDLHHSAGPLEPGEHTFSAFRGDVAIVSAGTAIRAEAFPYQDGYRIERVFRADEVAEKVSRDVNAKLRREVLRLPPDEILIEGDVVPNFALFNQFGESVQSRSWRGERVVMNFIFTRCGNPDMCPASTLRMARIQEEASARGIENLRLVTVSFDPRYDTPGVLHAYATDRGLDFANFSLLTGSPEAVRDVLRLFGIVTIGDPHPMMQHTMATLLIDETGKIAYRREGSRWSAEEFLARLDPEAES